MPRRAKGPRLYLEPDTLTYVIRDGTRKRGTGCGPRELGRAEEKLRDYIAQKYQPLGDHRPDRVLVADALTFYLREVARHHRSPVTTATSIDRLLDWWQERPLSDIKKSTCREYVEHRTAQPIRQARSAAARKHLTSASTARRELGVLQAAINAYHAEHNLNAVPIVSLPDASPPRERWLTRAEAAGFLRAARKHPEKPARTALTRFFLIGLYTGSRSGVIRSLAWLPAPGGAWLDLDAGVMHRRGRAEDETKKRRPPLRIPTRLLGHLRRWKRRGNGAYVVDQGFGPMKSQRRAWAWARSRSGLGADVVPHVLRHTAATWIMQQGPDLWEAAGYLGMSPEILWKVYGHHHPDWQKDLAAQIGRSDRNKTE